MLVDVELVQVDDVSGVVDGGSLDKDHYLQSISRWMMDSGHYTTSHILESPD